MNLNPAAPSESLTSVMLLRTRPEDETHAGVGVNSGVNSGVSSGVAVCHCPGSESESL